MNFNVNQVSTVKSATEKRDGRGRQGQNQRPDGSFAAALARAAREGDGARRDGFAAPPDRINAGALAVQALGRHVLYVNENLLGLLRHMVEA